MIPEVPEKREEAEEIKGSANPLFLREESFLAVRYRLLSPILLTVEVPCGHLTLRRIAEADYRAAGDRTGRVHEESEKVANPKDASPGG